MYVIFIKKIEVNERREHRNDHRHTRTLASPVFFLIKNKLCIIIPIASHYNK
uniref:Uncharacterized protein n=1 Tax=Papilio xuthus TaxID=66420 RepID=I4DNM8_PAPXU|nr:unknown unsecreted protein [Papilio xuthus]